MDLSTVHHGVHRRKKKKRIGRGPGSKKGRTATRGGKGQTARSGDLPRLLKEGGQMQLFRRIPKRGFNNAEFRLDYAVVNVVDLANFPPNAVVTVDVLEESGLAKVRHDAVKILGDGELDRPLEVHAHKFSESAKEKIEKAGGKCIVVPGRHVGPKIKNKMRPRKPKTPIQ
ncbi:MAG TPA: 50S ribosomal protein L15 [Planctomycetia bacterium]|nr:50S ribosomal protein L15 [Planctomycetia bacterium]